MKNTSLCYIEKDGKYLMLHRIKKENDQNRDKWIGIGGGFEDGESPDECARREIFEETGLKVKELRLRGVITFVADIWECEYMHLFSADSFNISSGGIILSEKSDMDDITKAMKDCDEGVLEWIDKDMVPSLPIWEGDRIFLDLLDRKGDVFLLKLRYEGDRLAEAVLDGKRL